jgi:hypothetical protein
MRVSRSCSIGSTNCRGSPNSFQFSVFSFQLSIETIQLKTEN